MFSDEDAISGRLGSLDNHSSEDGLELMNLIPLLSVKDEVQVLMTLRELKDLLFSSKLSQKGKNYLIVCYELGQLFISSENDDILSVILDVFYRISALEHVGTFVTIPDFPGFLIEKSKIHVSLLQTTCFIFSNVLLERSETSQTYSRAICSTEYHIFLIEYIKENFVDVCNISNDVLNTTIASINLIHNNYIIDNSYIEHYSVLSSVVVPKLTTIDERLMDLYIDSLHLFSDFLKDDTIFSVLIRDDFILLLNSLLRWKQSFLLESTYLCYCQIISKIGLDSDLVDIKLFMIFLFDDLISSTSTVKKILYNILLKITHNNYKIIVENRDLMEHIFNVLFNESYSESILALNIILELIKVNDADLIRFILQKGFISFVADSITLYENETLNNIIDVFLLLISNDEAIAVELNKSIDLIKTLTEMDSNKSEELLDLLKNK